MKKTPIVIIKGIKLACPDCDAELSSDICGICGCEISLREIMIDIQPEEILTKSE